MAIVNYAVTVTGRVQGVSYRYYASIQAARLGVTGWVKNNPDGSVSLEAEGKKENTELFLEWCRHGPRFAAITDIRITPGQPKYFTSFDIIP